MKFNPRLKIDMMMYRTHVIVVEGKKHVLLFKELGFDTVYPVHITGISLPDRVDQIAALMGPKDRVCILTDFDKRGRKLYMQVKELFAATSVKVDSSLRGLLHKGQLSHIEDLKVFWKKIEKIG